VTDRRERKPIAAAKPVKVVAALHLHYYLAAGKHENGGASMNRSLVILALATLATGCTVAATSGGSPGTATEASLMQADRDFAVATHARGIDGWMSFYAPDAIRILYRGNMV
jgi:hypothetical protein